MEILLPSNKKVTMSRLNAFTTRHFALRSPVLSIKIIPRGIKNRNLWWT